MQTLNKLIYIFFKVLFKITNKLCEKYTSVGVKINDIGIGIGTKIDSESKIGSFTYIGKYCYITKTEIGRYCSIANNVSIGQGDHDLHLISTSSIFYDNPLQTLTIKDCIIGNDVWIGVDAIILRGVKIGDGAVIGANSVVTQNIPPYAVAVGSPARIIKYRFEKSTIEEIAKSNWWSKPPEEAKEIIGRLQSSTDYFQ